MCKACGHAFLLSPDGTAESLQRKEEKQPESEPDNAAAEAQDGPEDLPPAPQPTGDEGALGQPEAGPSLAEEPAPASDALGLPASEQTQELEALRAPAPVHNVPAFAAPEPNQQAEVAAPPPQPEPDASPRALRPRRGGMLVLVPLMFVLGAGVGVFASRWLPLAKQQPVLAPAPPSAPPPPVAAAKKPQPDLQKMFIVADAPLWAGPQSGGVYPQLATLVTGSAVSVVVKADPFALVRDAMGRAGFVHAKALVSERPAASFVDCARAPIDADSSTCEKRAAEQLAACKAACAEDACTTECEKNHAACVSGCSEVGVVSALSAASPTADEGAAAEVRNAQSGKGGKKAHRKGKKRGGAKRKGGGDLDIPLPVPEPVD